MTNDLREAYISSQAINFRDVFVPAITDAALQATAAATTDEQLREALGAAYDKMMGPEKVTVSGFPPRPDEKTAALAIVPDRNRHLHGGKAVISVTGPDIVYGGRTIGKSRGIE
ncbi:MAG: hypothetical protein V4735_06600 [Pseudomonadota bacterium]